MNRLVFFAVRSVRGIHFQSFAAVRRTGMARLSGRAVLPSLSLCFFAATTAFAQVRPVWTNRYDNALTSKTNTPLGIALDPSGNVLVAGSSVNTSNDWDYVMIKYASSGTPLWTNRYDSGSNDFARGFVADKAGNAVLTGTSQTVKFGTNGAVLWAAPNSGRAVATDTNGDALVTGFSEVDFATAKIHGATGTNVWTRTYDKIGFGDVSQAVSLDDAGNVYVAGSEVSLFIDGFTYFQLAVVKYDASGQQVWVRDQFDNGFSYGPGEVRGLIVDQSRNLLYLSANTRLTLGRTFITAQIRVDGQVNWTTYQAGADEGLSFSALAGDGGLRLTGRRIRNGVSYIAYATFRLNPDSSTNQSPAWATYYGPDPGYSRANAVAVDSANNAFITGLSPGTGSGNDFVTISYDPNGSQRWLERWSSAGNFSDEATGIAVDAGGNVYVTGYATTPQGGTEILTIKYAPTNPPPVQIKPNGSALLQLPRPAGQPFSIESSTNLSFWQPLGLATTDVTGLLIFEDTNAPAYSARYYRTVPP